MKHIVDADGTPINEIADLVVHTELSQQAVQAVCPISECWWYGPLVKREVLWGLRLLNSSSKELSLYARSGRSGHLVTVRGLLSIYVGKQKLEIPSKSPVWLFAQASGGHLHFKFNYRTT
ncbi:hypothetical protein PGT21_003914 [Puccinia graminis f. sp. tritici]|uniref:Uncharacterized protein n=1 Tax=Puccinia graminis f. sp. tritici TaxID=56615 RepID=A0A5B0LK56_PUCGR|nr:hypothetical protein PGT21_003914 [Puccinia graminis f. sp. tritici]